MGKKGKVAAQSKNSPLRTLFAERVVKIADGATVTVRPLPLREMSRCLGVLINLAAASKAEGYSPATVISSLGDDLFSMIDSCLVAASVDDIPLAYSAPLLEAIVDMNLPEEAQKNWKSLLTRLPGQGA